MFSFYFSWKKDTTVAFLNGFLVIMCSIFMLMFSNDTKFSAVGTYLFRDFFMIFILGFVFPLHYVLIVKKESISILGITKNNWLFSVSVNIILGLILLFQFNLEAGELGKKILIDGGK